MLFHHCECPEEGTRNVVAECLGKLTLIIPEQLLPLLKVGYHGYNRLLGSASYTGWHPVLTGQANFSRLSNHSWHEVISILSSITITALLFHVNIADTIEYWCVLCEKSMSFFFEPSELEARASSLAYHDVWGNCVCWLICSQILCRYPKSMSRYFRNVSYICIRRNGDKMSS